MPVIKEAKVYYQNTATKETIVIKSDTQKIIKEHSNKIQSGSKKHKNLITFIEEQKKLQMSNKQN